MKPRDFQKRIIKFPEIPSKIKTIIDNHSNMYLVDLKNEKYFENAPFYNDTLMYYDEYHLNHYGSIKYAEFEGHKLATLIKEIKNKNSK